MSGEFRTYDEQIAKPLEKGLAVPDAAAAKERLAAVGYFALVSGSGTRRYKSGVVRTNVKTTISTAAPALGESYCIICSSILASI